MLWDTMKATVIIRSMVRSKYSSHLRIATREVHKSSFEPHPSLIQLHLVFWGKILLGFNI